MKDLQSFLSRFNTLLSSRKATQVLLSEAVEETLGLSIDPDNIATQGATIYIKNSNSVIKNEILIKKETVLEVFYKKGGSRSLTNII